MEGARVEFDESFDERKGKPRAERVTGGTQGEDRGPPAPRDNTCRDFARGNCNRDNCRFSHDGGGGGGGGFGGGGGYGGGRDSYHPYDRDGGRGGGGGGYDRGGSRGYDDDRGYDRDRRDSRGGSGYDDRRGPY